MMVMAASILIIPNEVNYQSTKYVINNHIGRWQQDEEVDFVSSILSNRRTFKTYVHQMKAEFTARNQPPNFDVQNEISFYHPII